MIKIYWAFLGVWFMIKFCFWMLWYFIFIVIYRPYINHESFLAITFRWTIITLIGRFIYICFIILLVSGFIVFSVLHTSSSDHLLYLLCFCFYSQHPLCKTVQSGGRKFSVEILHIESLLYGDKCADQHFWFPKYGFHAKHLLCNNKN